MKLLVRTHLVLLPIQMAASLKQTVSLMSKVTANMPLTETSKLMDSLEKNFEDLEVKTKVMDDAMQNATTVQQPVDQVANLMQEMADEAGIELNLNMPVAPAMGTSVAMKEQVRRLVRLAILIGRVSSGRTHSAAGEIARNLDASISTRTTANEDKRAWNDSR